MQVRHTTSAVDDRRMSIKKTPSINVNVEMARRDILRTVQTTNGITPYLARSVKARAAHLYGRLVVQIDKLGDLLRFHTKGPRKIN